MYKKIFLSGPLVLILSKAFSLGQSLGARVVTEKMKGIKLPFEFLLIANTTASGNAIGMQQTGDSWLNFTTSFYVLLGVILVLLIVFAFFGLTLRKKKSRLSHDLQRIRGERESLRNELAFLTRNLEELQAIRLEEKSQLELLREEQQLAKNKLAAEEESLVKTVVWDKPEVAQKAQQVFYTRYADLMDGFSTAALRPNESSETIFEITIQSPNQASFRVSNNAAAQKYALSNADYFLERTCHYDTPPSGTIITETPGQLSLAGEKWEIREQARISFQ